MHHHKEEKHEKEAHKMSEKEHMKVMGKKKEHKKKK